MVRIWPSNVMYTSANPKAVILNLAAIDPDSRGAWPGLPHLGQAGAAAPSISSKKASKLCVTVCDDGLLIRVASGPEDGKRPDVVETYRPRASAVALQRFSQIREVCARVMVRDDFTGAGLYRR